jgi:hypothetical protein
MITALLTMTLVVTAGCAGVGLGGSDSSTLGASDYETHRSTLQDAGSATIIMNVTVPSQDQTVELNGVTKADFENDRAVSDMMIPLFGGINIAQYYDGSKTYERTKSSIGGTEYNVSSGDGTYMETVLLNESDDESAGNGSVDVTGESSDLTFERVDGDEGYQGATIYRANHSQVMEYYEGEVDGSVVNATMEIHQTDDGLFNQIYVRVISEVGGERQLTELKLRVTDLGETEVTQPDWVETAKLMGGNSSSAS